MALVLLLTACGGGELTGGTNVPAVTDLVTNEIVCSVASDPPCFVPDGWIVERWSP